MTSADIYLYISIMPSFLCINLLIKQFVKGQNIFFRQMWIINNLVYVVVGFSMSYSLVHVMQRLALNGKAILDNHLCL